MEEVSALVARCDSCDFSGFHIAEYGAHYIYRRAVRPQVEPFRKPYARQRKKKKSRSEKRTEVQQAPKRPRKTRRTCRARPPCCSAIAFDRTARAVILPEPKRKGGLLRGSGKMKTEGRCAAGRHLQSGSHVERFQIAFSWFAAPTPHTRARFSGEIFIIKNLIARTSVAGLQEHIS